jgi:valyl-tRNA synthetase
VETRTYRFWLEGGYFRAEINPARQPSVISMPPPNVYGSLHMGHGFNLTLQDLMTRWWRMQGRESLWLPGLDHAGLAFQNAVEKELRKEGLTRFDLGREKFLERCWAWKEEQSHYVVEQLAQMGASADWQRQRFTMDDAYQHAVRLQFVQLFDEGLIYRGTRIINWCPSCLTALADIEVEHEDEDSSLWYVRYPAKEGGDFLTVATTRPETILGDTAVAVNPEDPRYRDWVGRTLILPVLEREIPVVADEAVEREFATGAVKVTPAHDPTDFEIGRRHGLPQIRVIDDGGNMNAEAGPYQGLSREEARRRIVDQLRQEGLLVKEEPYRHAVGQCYRCHSTIEPILSTQWFCRMDTMAQSAMEVVKNGQVEFIPPRWTKIYMDWMENIQPWCISRQVWWGHRIPVWYCVDCGQMFAALEDPDSCRKCGSPRIEQDPDVLDTWFSSNLWPFAILGWPEQTPELDYFFPNTVLSTAYDILFFWVARMIMASLKFTGQIPFRKVYIHGLIRDGKGRKMSRSLGNVIDPLEKVHQFGADAFRFSLAASATLGGQDIPMGDERFEHGRNFTNKLWNASRFVLMNLQGFDPRSSLAEGLPHRYIRSRLAAIVSQVTASLQQYNFAEAARELEEFFWGDFCDWYLEMAKTDLFQPGREKKPAQRCLHETLETLLRLLHPIMPFITEELWQKLPGKAGDALIIAPWPIADSSDRDPQAEETMDRVKELVRAVRNLRAEGNLPPGDRIAIQVIAKPPSPQPSPSRRGLGEGLQESEAYILSLARLSELNFIEEGERPKASLSTVVKGMEVFLPLAGERAQRIAMKLKKDLLKVQVQLDKVRQRLESEEFLAHAPTEVVAKQRTQESEMAWEADRLSKLVAGLRS